MPRQGSSRKHWVVFLLSSLALTGLIRFYMGNLAGQIGTQRDSRRIFGAAISTRDDMINIETGLRGYLIGGSKEYLRPYHEGLGRLVGDSATLRARVSGNAGEREVYRELDNQIRLILAEFANLIDVTERDGIDTARKRFHATPTKPTMDRIRVLITTIIAAESQQLDSGRFRLDHTLTTATTLQDMSIAVTAFIVLALAFSLLPLPQAEAT